MIKTSKIQSVVVVMPKQDKPVIGITPKQAIEFFDGIGSAKMITLETLTKESQLRVFAINGSKERCNYGENDVLKHCFVNGVIASDYEAAVNRQLVKEGKEPIFKAEKPAWGHSVGDGKTLETHEKIDGEKNLYVAFRPLRCLSKEYLDTNEKKIDENYLKRFIKEKIETTRQGTGTVILWRKYKLSSIKGFNYGGYKFVICNDAEIMTDIKEFIEQTQDQVETIVE